MTETLTAPVLPDLEFQAWPKTPRLNRKMVVTEKIDGTNAAILITDDGRVGAQSRNRLVTPEQDNHGLAAWVHENADALRAALGPGRHFGEWWGNSIQRGYGLPKGERRFSLFNTARWVNDEPGADPGFDVPGLGVVPIIGTGNFSTLLVNTTVEFLREHGSLAAPGFMRPEGVVVFHTASRSGFKVTCEKDELPKQHPDHPDNRKGA